MARPICRSSDNLSYTIVLFNNALHFLLSEIINFSKKDISRVDSIFLFTLLNTNSISGRLIAVNNNKKNTDKFLYSKKQSFVQPSLAPQIVYLEHNSPEYPEGMKLPFAFCLGSAYPIQYTNSLVFMGPKQFRLSHM